VTDPYIGQDAADDNGPGGEGDGYPVTGNAELDGLLRRIVTEGNFAEAAAIGRRLAHEVVDGPDGSRDVRDLIYDLTAFLTPDEIMRVRALGREMRLDERPDRYDVPESPSKPFSANPGATDLFGMHEKEVRACIVTGARDRYADQSGPGQFDADGFFVVRHLGAKPAVCRVNERGELEAQTFDDFKRSYIDLKYRHYDPVAEKMKLTPAAKYWLEMQTSGKEYAWSRVVINRYDRADFLPGREDAPEGVFNMWRGWPDGCRPGDEMQKDDEKRCKKMRDHILHNMCGGDEELNLWLLGFLRDMILNPGTNRPIAVLMKGPQGSGKSMFCQLIGQWFGPHYLYAEDADRLLGKFNRHLDARVMVFLDEPKGGDMRREASKLKTLVATETLNIERKGFDIETRRKVFRVFAASNDAQIAHIEKDDRRYLILIVDAGANNNNATYFGALKKEWESGGREAMFRWLRDSQEHFAKWDWNKRPVTEALQEQKDLSLTAAEAAVQSMLDDGTLPELHKKMDGGAVFVATKSFIEHYKLDSGPNAKDNTTSVGRLLRELADPMPDPRESFPNPVTGRSDPRRGHLLPALHEARARWEKLQNRRVPWTTSIDHWPGCEPLAPRPKQDDIPF
jgi:hypothetical protein